MIDPTYFRMRFPEFSDPIEYTDERIQMFIDDTTCYMGTDELRWCGCYDRAQAYLAAHLLILGTATEAGDSGANAGPVTQKSAGGVSVSRATTSMSDNGDEFYSSTAYGQVFLSIRNRCFAGVLVANRL